MSGQSSLYTFSDETKQTLKKFRLTSSRANGPQALLVKINEAGDITIEDTDPSPIVDMNELVDLVPDNTPRFILLSYPLESSDGRKTVPYVLIYYRPETATQSNRMVYAGAVELLRNEAGVSKVIDIEESDELEDLSGLVVG